MQMYLPKSNPGGAHDHYSLCKKVYFSLQTTRCVCCAPNTGVFNPDNKDKTP